MKKITIILAIIISLSLLVAATTITNTLITADEVDTTRLDATTTNSSIGIFSELNVTNDLKVDKNLIVDGNATIDGPYAEMYLKNTSVTINLISQGTPVEFENLTIGAINDFTFLTSDNATIEAHSAGTYSIHYSVSYSASATGLFDITIRKNGAELNNGVSRRKINAGADIGNQGGTAIVNLAIGDNITLAIEDTQDAIPADPTLQDVNFIIHRIGN